MSSGERFMRGAMIATPLSMLFWATIAVPIVLFT